MQTFHDLYLILCTEALYGKMQWIYNNTLISEKIAIVFRDAVPAVGITKKPEVKISIFSMKSFENKFNWTEDDIYWETECFVLLHYVSLITESELQQSLAKQNI